MENKFRQLLVETLMPYGLPEVAAEACAKEFYAKLTSEFGLQNRVDGLNFDAQLKALDAYCDATKNPEEAFEATRDMNQLTTMLVYLRSTPRSYPKTLQYLESEGTAYELLPMPKGMSEYITWDRALDFFWSRQRHKAMHLRRQIGEYLTVLEKMRELSEPERSAYILTVPYSQLLGVVTPEPNDMRTVEDSLEEEFLVALFYPALAHYNVPTIESLCSNTIAVMAKPTSDILVHRTRAHELLSNFLKQVE